MRTPKLVGLPLPSLAGGRLGPIEGAALPAYANIILASSPQAYWKCGETSGTLADSSGNGNSLATAAGTPVYRASLSPFGYGVRYPSGAGITKSGVVSTAVNNFSFEMWLLPESCSALALVWYNGNQAANGWGLLMDGVGLISFYAGGVVFGGSSATRLTFGAWNHVVVARDATQWKFWINGALDTGTLGTDTPVTPSGGTSGFAAGTSRQIITAQCAVYNSVLTLAQIRTRYLAGKRGRYGVKVA